MARTRAADYQQRREAILDEAAALFASQGFEASSLADLARACSASKSLIYHYYPSKEDILHAVMSSHIDQLVEDVDRAFAQSPDAQTRLNVLIHAFMAHYVGAADRHKVLLNELNRLAAADRASIVGKQRRLVDAVEMLLVELDPSLGLDPARARAKTMLLFGMINWTHTWYDPAGPIPPAQIADMALRMIQAS